MGLRFKLCPWPFLWSSDAGIHLELPAQLENNSEPLQTQYAQASAERVAWKCDILERRLWLKWIHLLLALASLYSLPLIQWHLVQKSTMSSCVCATPFNIHLSFLIWLISFIPISVAEMLSYVKGQICCRVPEYTCTGSRRAPQTFLSIKAKNTRKCQQFCDHLLKLILSVLRFFTCFWSWSDFWSLPGVPITLYAVEQQKWDWDEQNKLDLTKCLLSFISSFNEQWYKPGFICKMYLLTIIWIKLHFNSVAPVFLITPEVLKVHYGKKILIHTQEAMMFAGQPTATTD